MPSFFTVPKSERKRKRPEGSTSVSLKKQRRGVKDAPTDAANKHTRRNRDESIPSGSSDGSEGSPDPVTGDVSSSASGDENETAAERRLRLAERYLQNIKEDIDENTFDAADLDRDLVAERLVQDASKSKGKLYRRIASDYDFDTATSVQLRSGADCTTCVAMHGNYIYTASKDTTLTKWERPSKRSRLSHPQRRRPAKTVSRKGLYRATATVESRQHHTDSVLCMAVSPDGSFLATGGADNRLIIWSTETMIPLRVFSQHRDSVLGLAFRRETNQLYSGSADRTIKSWSLNEMAYVETLFGHQDSVLDVSALAQERCLSVGARDRTVRLWKVVEETQLVFRGGGSGGEKGRKSQSSKLDRPETHPSSMEGSIERVAYIDEDTFVSGSDNGSISLWSVHKKKPVFTLAATHGFDPLPQPQDYYADMGFDSKSVPGHPQARWITALVAIPYSDLILSGSWDGCLRVWKVSKDKKGIEAVGTLGSQNDSASEKLLRDETGAPKDILSARGVINNIAFLEHGDRDRETLFVVAALGTEHRLGRWKKLKGKNGAVLFEITKTIAPHT